MHQVLNFTNIVNTVRYIMSIAIHMVLWFYSLYGLVRTIKFQCCCTPSEKSHPREILGARSHNEYHPHSVVTRENHSQVTCTYACFLMFVITDMGSLKRTEVPRNLRCPTAVRKSANGKASFAPVPNTLQNTKMIFKWYFFIGSQISISLSLIQF